MVVAAGLARVAGMLVLEPERLHEADRLESACAAGSMRLLDELLLVLEVRLPVREPLRGIGIEAREVVERLMVVLEHVARTVRIDSDVRPRIDVRIAAGRPVPVRP